MNKLKRKLVVMLEKALLEHEEKWNFVETAISDINNELREHNRSFIFSIAYNTESCDVYLSGKTNNFNMSPRKLLTIQIAPLSIVTADAIVTCSKKNLAVAIVEAMSRLKEWPHYAGMIRTFK